MKSSSYGPRRLPPIRTFCSRASARRCWSVRLHQNPVRGQDRIAVEPLSEVQRGLHLGEVPHDEVGLVASPGARPESATALELRSSISVDEAADQWCGTVRDSWLSARGTVVMAVGAGRSLTQRARAAGASMGVSGQVTTLKCDYRVGDGY